MKTFVVLAVFFVMALACGCGTMAAAETYDPPSGRGPIVVLISGSSGPPNYRSYAAEVAKLGYYAVLLDGEQYFRLDSRGLRSTIEKTQKSPKAIPGKVAVIGFSMGGGTALYRATSMPDIVSAVIAYYPYTSRLGNLESLAAEFQVPILVFAGEKDTYYNCCLIEDMRRMEAAAKKGSAPFELVVYPKAGHAFTWAHLPAAYKAEESADAWQRTIKMLSQYHPLR